MISLDLFLGRLEGVRRHGDRALARCPAHDDRSPSLSIRQARDWILVHCFAGCDTRDVLAAIGLTYPDILPNNQGIPLRKCGVALDRLLSAVHHELTVVLLVAEDLRAGQHADRVLTAIGGLRSAREALKHGC